VCRLPLCYVCIGVIGCCWCAFSQQKTERGFYFPTDVKANPGQAIRKDSRGFLSGCTAGSTDFHVGVDLLAGMNRVVYAISSGTVAAKSRQGQSTGAVALLIQHKPPGGAEFYAVYGNIRTTLDAGVPVAAGQPIGGVGHSPHQSHLHFAVIMKAGDTPPAPADWYLLPCSRWSDHVRYADPLEWLGSVKLVADSPLNRCDLNGDGVVDTNDVELARLMALGIIPCTADLDEDGKCTVVEVQRIVNAVLTGACRVGR
jgi:hypothetical protein